MEISKKKNQSTRREFIRTSGLLAGAPVFINPITGWMDAESLPEIQDPATSLANLRCEYLVNPPGIDTAKPRFSWEINDPRRGVRQTAFQILVASDPAYLDRDHGDLWDTGRVSSQETLHIEYGGIPLFSGMHCWWKLRIWTTALDSSERECSWSKKAFFSVGLLDEADWKAHWITTPEFIPDSPMHVGYMSESTIDPEEPKWIQIDLGRPQRFDKIRLYPAVGRRGVLPPGGEVPPGDGFPLRLKIEVSDHEDMKGSHVVADHAGNDIKNPRKKPFTIPVKETRGRYVRLTALKHASDGVHLSRVYVLKLAQMEVLKRDRNIALNCRATALDSFEDIPDGYGISLLTNGKKTYDPGMRRHIRPSPLLRGEFTCTKPVSRAIAYATALGNYELYMNGKRIADHCMAPGYTQYEKRVAVQAYDVTGILKEGKNAAGAILADGWYRVRYRLDDHDQYKEFVQGRFGDAIPRFLMQLNIEFEDGSSEVIGTDQNWWYTLEGPFRRTSMYDGVEYDSRREIPGWKNPGFEGEGWSQAVISRPGWNPQMWPQSVQPIKVVQEISPVSITPTGRGTWLVDFGQGVGGVCRVTLDGPENMRVGLHHAMAVNPDNSLDTQTLWGAYNNADTYILRGEGPRTFEAPFTFHGFRFVEISGMESAENLVDIKALMISDEFHVTASIDTSDKRLNKLWELIELSYLSCLKGVMIDGADRDERWPWMGDCGTTQTQSEAYMFDMPAFFRKRCLDLMDDQWEDGYFTPKSPEMDGGGPSAVYSDGALTHAWSSWLNYGNRRLLEEVYSSLRRYVLVLMSKFEAGEPIWPFNYGDWLSSYMTVRAGASDWQDKGPAQISGDLYQKFCLIRNVRLLRKIAGVLGNSKDEALLETYFQTLMADPSVTGLRSAPPTNGAQSAYAISLEWEASGPEETEQLMDSLLEAIEAYGGHPSTGTSTTLPMLNVLSENGHHDLAWHLAMKPEYPSFGFMVDNDASAIWERFDTFIPGMGYNPEPMNSLNHVGFCSVAEWIFQTVSGIYPDPDNPAYSKMLIEPRMEGPLGEASTVYHSVRGEISTRWTVVENKVSLELVIPPNTSAIVRLPAADPEMVTESGNPVSESPGVVFRGMKGNFAEFDILSGTYLFGSDYLLQP